MAEKYWEGCGDLSLNEGHKNVISGQASLMTLAYPDWFFDGIPTILLYPTPFVAEGVTAVLGGQYALHGESPRSGETYYRGPLILNWADVLESGIGPNDGNGLAFHEFAHQFDFGNGSASDGVPPLPSNVDAEQWQEHLEDELEEQRESVARGWDTVIDDYGLTSLGEFFAVSSEAYFQIPHELAEYHPSLFHLLLQFYQRDWREWLPRY
jgi:MtfA peptidase